MTAIVLGRQAKALQEVREQQAAQYLTFVVGAESFGIAISGVREIIEYHAPTSVPMMPAFIRGVINLRGRVVPVIDLQARFGRASSPVTRRTCIVVLDMAGGAEHQALGAVVDSVTAVVDIDPADIEPPPSFGAPVRNDFIVGMGKAPGGFILILDASRVMSVEELASIAAGGAGALPDAAADAAAAD
jgi:purine-binding chemotaxis protein CheW